MMKHIYSRTGKKGVTWYYQFTVNGQPYQGKIGRVTEKEAHTLAEEKYLKVLRGEVIQRPPQSPRFGRWDAEKGEFTDAALEFVNHCRTSYRPQTMVTTECILRCQCAYFGAKRLDEISPLMVEQYKQSRHATGIGDSMLLRDLGVLRRLFNVAISLEFTNANPVQRVKKPKESPGRTRCLSEEEEAQLLEQCAKNQKLATFIVAMVDSGFRPCELQHLRWQDIDFQRRTISCQADYSYKNDEGRTNPLTTRLYEALLAWRQRNPGGIGNYVFGRYTTYLENFKRARDKAGISADVVPYSLRHTCFTRINNRGGNLRTIQDLAGHKLIRHTQRYTHPDAQAKRDAVALLEPELRQKLRQPQILKTNTVDATA